METSESFVSWLKKERKRRRLTQRQLGQYVSYSADHIRKVEAGERHFGEAQARLFAEYLGVPPEEQDAFIAWARGGPRPYHLSFLFVADQPAGERARNGAPVIVEREPDAGNKEAMHGDDPSSTEAKATGKKSSGRFRWQWAGGIAAAVVAIITVTLVAYQHGQAEARGRIVPGGRWLIPDQNFMVRGESMHFAARAYPSHPGDPPIAVVNFTVSWLAPNGEWGIACVASAPAAGTTDRYECDWNLAAAQAPNGVMKASFDVYDAKGNVNMAPNGIHEGTVQR